MSSLSFKAYIVLIDSGSDGIIFTEHARIFFSHYALKLRELIDHMCNLGEDDAVAAAVNEHYMPRAAGGEVPSTFTGAVVALADKLDTIASYFRRCVKKSRSSFSFSVSVNDSSSLNEMPQLRSIRMETMPLA
jgi:hypothetical protein